MVRDGYALEEITDIMETRIRYREKREKIQADMLRSMGTLAPAWGMIGTLMGLVVMLAGFGGEGGADGAAIRRTNGSISISINGPVSIRGAYNPAPTGVSEN